MLFCYDIRSLILFPLFGGPLAAGCKAHVWCALDDSTPIHTAYGPMVFAIVLAVN